MASIGLKKGKYNKQLLKRLKGRVKKERMPREAVAHGVPVFDFQHQSIRSSVPL